MQPSSEPAAVCCYRGKRSTKPDQLQVAGSSPAGGATSGQKQRIGFGARHSSAPNARPNYRSDRSLTGHQKYFFAQHSRAFDVFSERPLPCARVSWGGDPRPSWITTKPSGSSRSRHQLVALPSPWIIVSRLELQKIFLELTVNYSRLPKTPPAIWIRLAAGNDTAWKCDSC